MSESDSAPRDLSKISVPRKRVDQLVNRAWKEARRGATAAPEKVAMHIARDIVRQIGNGHFSSGDPLPSEAEMAVSYNVGRTSVREALRVLEVQGLITIKTGPGGGPTIKDPTSADVGRMLSMHFNVRACTFSELAQARLQLDPLLARLAAENVTQEAVERLRDIIELMEAIPPNNNAEWARTARAVASSSIDAFRRGGRRWQRERSCST